MQQINFMMLVSSVYLAHQGSSWGICLPFFFFFFNVPQVYRKHISFLQMKIFLVASCPEAEFQLYPLANIRVCKLLRCSSVSRGKRYYFKCIGTIVQKESWWKRNICILCKYSCVANAQSQGHSLQLVKRESD